MRKMFFILGAILLSADYATGAVYTENTQNNCDTVSPVLTALFEPNEYTCSTGYYLPANHEGCEPCPSEHTCSGGTFLFDENVSQGITYNKTFTTGYNYGCDKNKGAMFFTLFAPNEHNCPAGQYLPAGIDECTQCPSGSACIGGTYSFNETTDQGIQSCANGTFSPSGSAVCYPHILHVGNDIIYLRSTKLTTPSLNFRIGNDIFYANMTTTRTKMNKDSEHYFHAQWENNHYYVCDDTTCPQ